MPTVQFTMRVDAELKAALEEEARREDISASQLAARAIRSHIGAKEAERAAIEAAVLEADKGVFISEAAFTAWVSSWDTDNELPPPKPDIFPETQ
jgi:predicted transcriptional regulator